MGEALLEVKGLKKHFPIKGGILSKTVNTVKAVDGLNFIVEEGETLGLVGESGCGKSTTGRVLLRLLEATEGEVIFNNQNIFDLGKREMRSLRREMQMIFQDPYASLNPRMTVGDIIGEAMAIHGLAKGKDKERKVRELLEKVGLTAQQMRRYPHEFSGGQRQRIGIARALAVDPKIIICDEPVSALDVSIQAQVINLMEDLQEELGLTYIFIAHDLSVVKHISDRVAVMYLGKMVELADKEELYSNSQHPYTKALLSAIPLADPTANREKIILEGDVPSPINPPSGCSFHPRCPFAKDICSQEEPEFVDRGNGHFVACHLDPEEI
ncbi:MULTISPECIES: ABC transporter ATP-binding protein [unclassified Candidatus Frackibacter]|nr:MULTISPECIES: dipeptide ABC transporter ATP-binding protein [unclassified Candidatus Frackibacter]SDC30329.1 oligopeptide transport system ATP-binding protein [Candidatus Frackibacter sp. WG11]SFL58165.1 oligopeptide transport system ATP-binding protein [Candidatus Frackibacter sp. WG13]